MNAGKWIFISFVLFALFIASLVWICMRQRIDLVSKNYYKEGQGYQQKIQAAKRVHELTILPEITFSNEAMRVSFPLFSELETGKLRLFRPSDERLDRVFLLSSSSDTIQYFPLSVWRKGLYRVSMEWNMYGKKFYIEQSIIL